MSALSSLQYGSSVRGRAVAVTNGFVSLRGTACGDLYAPAIPLSAQLSSDSLSSISTTAGDSSLTFLRRGSLRGKSVVPLTVGRSRMPVIPAGLQQRIMETCTSTYPYATFTEAHLSVDRNRADVQLFMRSTQLQPYITVHGLYLWQKHARCWCIMLVGSGIHVVQLGPIVGRVTSNSALILWEVDSHCRLTCILTDTFTNERIVVEKDCPAYVAVPFLMDGLRSDRRYLIAVQARHHLCTRPQFNLCVGLWIWSRLCVCVRIAGRQ